jgi:hypothetical protein
MGNPADRRSYFQGLVSSYGNKCSVVTKAVLKGGLEGIDLWKVTCIDSGVWLVTFTGEDRTEISNCSEVKGECDNAYNDNISDV